MRHVSSSSSRLHPPARRRLGPLSAAVAAALLGASFAAPAAGDACWAAAAAVDPPAEQKPAIPVYVDPATAAARAQAEGDRLLRSGDVAGAAASYLKAAQAMPGEPLYQITAGVALASAGRTAESLAAFRNAQRVAGSDVVVGMLVQSAQLAQQQAVEAGQQIAPLQARAPVAVRVGPAESRTDVAAPVLENLPSAPALSSPPAPGGAGGGFSFGGGAAAAKRGGAAAAPAAGFRPQRSTLSPGGGAAADDAAFAVASRSAGGMDTGASMRRLQQAAVRFPQSPVIYLLLGDAAQLSKRWGDAETNYRQAIKLAPRWAKPRVNLGLSLLAQGDSVRAIQTFQSALNLDPNDAQAQLGKGDAELQSGRPVDALRTYNNVANSSNRQVASQAATGIGQAYVDQGQLDSAFPFFTKARDLDPTDPAPAAAQGEAQFRAGDFSGAADSYQTALRLSQDGVYGSQSTLYQALASAQLSAGDADGVTQTVQRALAEAPERAALWHRLWAQALFQQRDPQAAERQLKRSLEADGARYPNETLNALALHAMIDRATADYAAALAADRTAADKVRDLRALAHLARYRGDVKAEIGYREALIKIRPSGVDWYALALARDRSGDPSGARSAYQTALGFGDLPASARQAARARVNAVAQPAAPPAVKAKP